jgi:hypothetical protein
MWPFSEMSLAAATLWGTLANWGLLVCLIGGVVSTFVVVKTADVKESHWKKARERVVSHMEELAAESLRAKAELESARAEIAKAQLKAEEIRERMAPRTLNEAAFLSRLKDKPRWAVVEIWYADESDSQSLAIRLSGALGDAGWTVAAPRPLRGPNPVAAAQSPVLPISITYGAQPSGITVVARAISAVEAPNPAAFLQAAIQVAVKGGNPPQLGRDERMKDRTLRIVISPKN